MAAKAARRTKPPTEENPSEDGGFKTLSAFGGVKFFGTMKMAGSDSDTVVKHGRDETQSERQRYHCRNCNRYFDDLTGTIFEGRHEPLSIWISCLHFMGLNLSNSRIAYELDPDTSNVQQMTEQLRQGVVARKPERKLSEQVECDELYVVAGHKGESKLARKKGVKVEVTV